jgi:hypothetical protein
MFQICTSSIILYTALTTNVGQKVNLNDLCSFLARGGAVVEALRYKPEGRGIDSRWGHFRWHNPSGRNMALLSTQPLTEMSTRNISWG